MGLGYDGHYFPDAIVKKTPPAQVPVAVVPRPRKYLCETIAIKVPVDALSEINALLTKFES